MHSTFFIIVFVGIRRFFFLTVFLFLIGNLISQNRVTDSLYNLIRNAKNDSNKVKLLNLMGWEVSYFDLDSGLKYGLKGLELAEKIKYYNTNGDLYNTVGAILSDQGNDREALKYFKLGLDNCSKYPDAYAEGSIYNSLGLMYQRKNEFDKSIKYYYSAINAYKKGNMELPIYTMYGNLAGVFQGNNNLDSALFYVQKTISYNIKKNKKKKLAYNYLNASAIYNSLNNDIKANEYAILAINIARAEKDNYLLSNALLNIGDQLNQSKKHIQSISYLTEAISIGKKAGEVDVLKKGYKFLSNSYAAINDYKKAFEFQLNYQFYKDSMFNVDNNKIIKELEAKYEVEKKQKEISELNEKNRVQQIVSEKNRIMLYASIGGILALVIIAIVLQNRNSIKHKTNAKLELVNKEITLQKQKVEEHQKEILDSIKYASRIQKALMPNTKYIEKNLNKRRMGNRMII